MTDSIYQELKIFEKQDKILLESVDSQSEPKISQLKQQYDRILYKFKFSQFQLRQIKQQFKANDILYHQKYQQPSCEFTIQNQHHSAINAHVFVGRFQLILKLIIENRVSNLYKTAQNVKKGNFGRVYPTEFNGQQIVLKEILFQKSTKKSNSILNAIKQFSILKICSVLKCGPKIVNYIGFDLVVYSNLVMFAMENACPKQNFVHFQQKTLKQSLSLMHYFNIIHFDIKPQNIGFSRCHQRQVFLDFGLSEIIEQQLGSKSYSTFRGTLTYCSTEMTALFMEQNSNSFVDLYYNDAFCLNSTMSFIKHIQSQQQAQEHIRYNNQTQDSISIEQQINLLLIKHLFCVGEFNRSKKYLKLLRQNYLQLFLHFIMELASTSQFKLFFLNQMNWLKNKEEYSKLLYKMSNVSRVSLRTYLQRQTVLNNGNIFATIFPLDFKIFLKAHQQNQIQAIPLSCYQQFLKHHQITNQHQKLKHFTVFLKFIRFQTNYSQITFSQKIKYAKIFISIFKKTQTAGHVQTVYKKQLLGILTQIEQSLSVIRQAISIIIQSCLNHPFTFKKIKLLCQALLQAIIVDSPVSNLIKKMSQFHGLLCKSVDERMLLFFEMQNIMKINQMKYKYSHPQDEKQLRANFKQFQQILLREVLEDPQYKLIWQPIFKQLLQINLKQNLQNFNLRCSLLLKNISNYQLREKTFIFVYSFKLFYLLGESNLNSCFQVLEYLNSSLLINIFPDKNKICLNLGFSQYYTLMLKSVNINQVQKICILTEQSFGCEQISSKFIFKMNLFFCKQQSNEDQLVKYATQFINYPTQIDNSPISHQYKVIWDMWANDPSLCARNKDLVASYIARISDCFCFEQTNIQNFTSENIFYHATMLDFGLNFVIDKEQLITQIQNKIKTQIQNSTNSSIYVYFNLKYHLFQATINLKLQKYNQCYQSLNKLFKIAYEILSSKFITFCLKNMHKMAKFLNKCQIISPLLDDYYTICKQVNEYNGYFINCPFNIIVDTLQLLIKKQDKSSIYYFMKSLSQFISFYPRIENYHYWIQSLNIFFKQNYSCFHFETLQKYFKEQVCWKNPYLINYYAYALNQCSVSDSEKILIKIAFNIQRLKYFSKDFMVRHYYSYWLSDECRAGLRKKKCIYLRSAKHFKVSDNKKYKIELKSVINHHRQQSRTFKNLTRKFEKIFYH